MIKVKKIQPQTVEHFDNSGKSLGFLNFCESLDLRCQIMHDNVHGYFLMFESEKIIIKPNGELSSWPRFLYNQETDLLNKLFRI